MANERELTPAQEAMWATLERLGVNPEDYYDFEADEIKEFPPMPIELQKRLAEIRLQTHQPLQDLDQ